MEYAKRNLGEFILDHYTAQTVSEVVPPILKQFPNGTIHSVFNNSFNAIFQGNIVHIGASENGLAPFGMGLNGKKATSLTKEMEINLPVEWDGINQVLLFPKGIVLSLEDVVYKQPVIEKSAIDKTIIKKHFQHIVEKLANESWKFGLIEDKAEKQNFLHFLLDKEELLANSDVQTQVSILGDFIKAEDSFEEKDIFNYWIGRGPGLTPSGDDITTGICAVLTLVHGKYHPYLIQLKNYLIEKGRQRTTHVGYEYLIYAADARFHTSIVDLCASLLVPGEDKLQGSMAEMKKIGNTSGADTLMGVLLAIKMVVLNEE